MDPCPTCGQSPVARLPITHAGVVGQTASGVYLDGWGFDGAGGAVVLGGWSVDELAGIAFDLGTLKTTQ